MSCCVIDPVALTQDLIRFDSVSPDRSGAQAHIAEILRPLGFDIHILPFGETGNLFARIGTGSPHFCFSGHTDVVPPLDDAAWTYPPFEAQIHNGILYGRGACDMKSAIAAFVSAIYRFLHERPLTEGSISVMITGDEELSSLNGAQKLLPWMKDNDHIPDYALVGEPTNPDHHGQEIKIGRRGSLGGRVTVIGKAGHVAYQDLADNPIPRMIKVLQILSDFEFDQGSDYFAPTNLEITDIDTGNLSDNVIPAKITATFNIRFNNHWSAQTLQDRITALLPDTELQFFISGESFLTQPDTMTKALQDIVETYSGKRPSLTTSGGTSDARFIQQYCPVVEYGVINKTIHQIDESVAVKDIEILADIYTGLLKCYFD